MVSSVHEEFFKIIIYDIPVENDLSGEPCLQETFELSVVLPLTLKPAVAQNILGCFA